jgi:transcriptional regulator with XRE-family HTH domain
MIDLDIYLKQLGANIRKIRELKNVTQYKLAKDLMMEQSNLARIEDGKTNPTVKTLLKICDSLNVEMTKLFKFK